MAYTTIDDPELYFQTVLWSGDSNSPRTITFDGSEDMQPDWIWSKKRNSADYGQIYDSVRTFGAGKEIVPSDNFDEGNSTNNSTALGNISSVTSDGFVLTEGNHGTSSIRSLLNNHSGSTHVAWAWAAGGSASSNTDGSITSSVSVNTTAGFSICTFTQASSGSFTFGHGLGVAPSMVIGKSRGNTSNWQIFHTFLGTGKFIQLNSTQAQQTLSNFWGTIDTSIVTVGSNQLEASQPSVYYCFAEKKGYSKFGNYTGNGNADGTFTYLGFKPSFVMVRDPGNAENWLMYDNKRPGYNLNNNHLFANTSDAETASTANTMDLLSNGFKIRSSNNGLNRSGTSFFYMAFAEAPFVNSKGVPCNAR